MTRVVVVGATGFIGRAVASEVAARPEFELVRAAREPAANERRVDLTSPGTLRSLICPGDVIVNCAGYANALDVTDGGRELFERVNVDGVRALAEACVSQNALHLIHLSSVAAMGPLSGDGVSEEDRLPPASPYAASKLRAEALLASFRERLNITVLRPTSIFGEGRGLARSLCRLVSLPVLPLPGGGGAHIPFCYVENVAAAVVHCAGNPKCFGETFIVGDERSYTLREVVRAFAKALDTSPVILPVPVQLARRGAALEAKLARTQGRIPTLGEERIASLTRSVSYSIEKLQTATGYRPEFGLDEAARRIAYWYQKGVVHA